MLPFETAYETVMEHARPLPCERVPIADALNRTLREDVASDMDMPPFDRSAMDGYACRREDLGNELTVMETIPAGYVPTKTVQRNQCAKIMTGAVVPQGADFVVMVEDTEARSDGTIIITRPQDRDNIRRKSEDIRTGDVVLRAGARIRPHHIAVCASVGCVTPLVSKRPTVGVMATGDELVEPDVRPAPSQIRNSNGYQLCAQVTVAGGVPTYYGIARDTEASLDAAVGKALAENDVVLVSGGVSKGDFDLVPDLFTKNGVTILFDQVATKPGRPTVFGVSKDAACFGLPGNPVSTFVVFELLVRPFLSGMTGTVGTPPDIPMRLEKTVMRKKTLRRAHVPVAITERGGVVPVEYHGSAHINGLCQAVGLVAFPVGVSELKEGTVVPVRRIDWTD